MRFASIGSGSEGNGLLVEAGGTRVLVDCGFGVRDAGTRVRRLGVDPDTITAILVTHEHADHAGGVPAFSAKHQIPVWTTFGTLHAMGERFASLDVFGFDSHELRLGSSGPRESSMPKTSSWRVRKPTERGTPASVQRLRFHSLGR